MPTYTKSHSSLEQSSLSSVAGGSANYNSFHAQLDRRSDKKRASLASNVSLQSSSGTNNNNPEDSSLRLTSNANYDHIRDTTLMFFLDRLFLASKEGKEARSLHELSCLFGTREFTREMRQIVGASRNGLKKFLAGYPSLFTIDGEKVYLTQLKPDANSASVRDYNKEAVDYFRDKLLQFGASLVPIRNLFGYRSQASQEVRHVSGKNTKEFKQFLAAHSGVFEILADDEHVVLKSAIADLDHSASSLIISQQQQQQQHSLPQLHSLGSLPTAEQAQAIDPYLNKQLAHIIEDCLRQMLDGNADDSRRRGDGDESVSVSSLHAEIQHHCNNQLFLKMVKTVDDLKMFLRMHPKIFKRLRRQLDPQDGSTGTDFVRLLSEQERKELELQTYPSSLLNRQPSNGLHRSATNESDNLSSLSPAVHLSLSQPQSLPPVAAAYEQRTGNQLADRKLEDRRQQHRSDGSGKVKSSGASSSLRATAPPFVPQTGNNPAVRRQNSQLSASGQSEDRPIQRSVSNLTDRSNVSQRSSRPLAPMDPRQALRSYLIKANESNQLVSRRGSSGLYQQQQQVGRQMSSGCAVVSEQDDLRARTVSIVREASNIISRIMSSTQAVAFDCKGYNLGFDGQITLIQFGFIPSTRVSPASKLSVGSSERSDENKQPDGRPKPEVCVFDLITNPELAYCLKPLLESDQVVKIVHDVRNKSNALYVQFGIVLNHVFDTQVANLVIQQQETGIPAYKSRYISMSKLCEIYGDDSLLMYRNIIKSRTRHSATATGNSLSVGQNGGSSSSASKLKDVNYWRTRPLTEAMVYESTMDVYCLIGGVYQNLKSRIKPEYEPLFEQLNLEGVLARIKPDEIRSVKKERKIDLEVIDLKRKLYSDSTSSIVLSNREIRLLRHIDLTDEVRKKIQQCRKVAKKLERLDMKAAQNAETQQSMGSQLTDAELADQSLGANASLLTSGSSGGTSCMSVSDGQQQTGSNDEAEDDGELAEMLVGDLMNGSMFDELKDKMIESSSLLESLEDDDDDDEVAAATGGDIHAHSSLLGGHVHDTNCRCLCHRGSNATDQSLSGSAEKAPISLISVSSSDTPATTVPVSPPPSSEGPEVSESGQAATELVSTTTTIATNKPNEQTPTPEVEESQLAEVGESKAVDMAVQCDLLS